MRIPPVLHHEAARKWITRTIVAAAVVAIGLHWINSRVAIVWQNQNPAHPTVLTAYRAFHSMATRLHEGRIGQVDLAALPGYNRWSDPSQPYERLPPGAEHRWVNFYTFDIGYSFIVEIARLAFPALPDNSLRALALQLVADALLVVAVYYVFSQWHVALGLIAAYLYSSNQAFSDLVSFPFYYYWDIPLTFVVLGALLLACRRPTEAKRWLTVGAFTLACGVWIRGSWWPLSAYLLALTVCVPALRTRLALPLIVFAVIATPQVVRASYARGQLTFTTRAVWHVAVVGLGYYPNPYGLRAQDETVFDLTRQKYGVTLVYEDFYTHDQAAKQEFLSIWRRDRGFVIRSFAGRLKESVEGATATSVRSFGPVPNVVYRLFGLIAFVVMVWRGGDRRVVALAAAGMFALYVVLTCVFYFVGLAYDNVPQVALFVLFLGGLDGALAILARLGARSDVARA
jgi:hypothetical protein